MFVIPQGMEAQIIWPRNFLQEPEIPFLPFSHSLVTTSGFGFNLPQASKMWSNWALPSILSGIAVLLVSSNSQAFVTSGRPSLMRTKGLIFGAARGLVPLHRSSSMVLGISDQEVIYDENGDINQDHVLDDYQKNPKGLAPGDVVVVAAKGLKFYHVRKYKDEGFDPEGMVGTIKQLKLKSNKWPGEDGLWTANRPVFVQFLSPMKFRAHFEFPELRRVTKEELEKFQAEKDAQDAAAAAAQAQLEAERAANDA